MAIIKTIIITILILFSFKSNAVLYQISYGSKVYNNANDYCRDRLDLEHALNPQNTQLLDYFLVGATYRIDLYKVGCNFDTNYQDGSITDNGAGLYYDNNLTVIDSCPVGTQRVNVRPKSYSNNFDRELCLDPPDSGNCNYLIQTGLNSFSTKKLYNSLAPMYAKIDVGSGVFCEYKKVSVGYVAVDGVDGCFSTTYLATGRDGKSSQQEIEQFMACGGDAYQPPPEDDTPRCAEGWIDGGDDFGCYPSSGSACPTGTFYDPLAQACINESGETIEYFEDGTIIDTTKRIEIIQNQDGTTTEIEYSTRRVLAPDGTWQEVTYTNTTTYDNTIKKLEIDHIVRQNNDYQQIEQFSSTIDSDPDPSILEDEEVSIGVFDTTSIFGSSQNYTCPSFGSFNVFGQEFSFASTLVCEMAHMFSYVLLFFGYLQGARIIFGGND